MTEVVLPNDTNPLNILLGGRLLYWMDMAAAITAQKHAQTVALTVSIDDITFYASAAAGDVMNIEARITRAFRTSMEVYIEVWKRNVRSGCSERTNDAFFTFVAVDDEQHPVGIPPLLPQTEMEQRVYDEALVRKQKRTGKRAEG